jgi:hypothetical protein
MPDSAPSPQAPDKSPLASYFANKPASDLISDCKTRELSQWNMLNSRGLPNLWRLAYAQAFGMDPASARNATQKLEFCGPQQNFVRFRVNLTRSLIKQRNVLAAGQRISFQCLAMNDDAASIAQVPICNKVMDYVFREAEGERVCYEALEADGYFGEGFIWSRWNIDGGDMVPVTKQVPVISPVTKQPVIIPPQQPGQQPQPMLQPQTTQEKSGAPILQSLYPWNVVREPFARKSPWIIVKEKVSKYELMALYPEAAEKLKGMSLNLNSEPGAFALFNWDTTSVTDDMVIVRHFYHEATKAVPNGRYVGFVDDLPLWDLPCPVPTGLPVVSVCSARYFDTLMGYPESADLFSIQEMIDELLSQSATNILKFGNQNLWGSDQITFDMDKFMEGGAYFSLPTGAELPQVVQYAQLPEAVKYLLEYLPERMNEIIGSNSVMRGEPDANISSGSFAALMQNIAEKFVSSTQATFDFAVNATGNLILELVRGNAETSFAAQVSGDANVAYLSYFTRDDLKGIKRVLVNRQSPLMNSIPGRFDVFAQTKDMPKDQRWAAVQMLKTGDDSAWTENDLSDVVYLRWENEQLGMGVTTFADGQSLVSKTDDVFIHCRSHSASLNRLRANPPAEGPQSPQWQQWAQACMAHVNHINEHGIAWMQTMPPFAAMLGTPPPPMFNPAAGGFELTAPAPPAGQENEPDKKQPNLPPAPPPQLPGAPGEQPANQPGKGNMPKPAEAAKPAKPGMS